MSRKCHQRYFDGSPVHEVDWAARVQEAQEAQEVLMNSPGDTFAFGISVLPDITTPDQPGL